MTLAPIIRFPIVAYVTAHDNRQTEKRLLTVVYAIDPRRGELFTSEWPDVDMGQKGDHAAAYRESGKAVMPMTPEVHAVFVEFW